MNAPHNINEPFNTIIDHIEMAIEFDNSRKVPYMPKQLVTTAYDLIFVTGYFTNTC